MKNRSFDPVQLCAEITLIVALCESLVMLATPALTPGLSLVGQTLVHVLLLILVAGPAVYWRCAINLSRLKPPTPDTPSGSKAPQKKTFSIGAAIGLTAAAQVLGLLGTVGLVLWFKHDLDKDAQVVFERGAERIESEVKRRFNQPLLGLKAARGAYTAATSLSRRQFQAYVESRDLATELPGIRGFGFVARVQRKNLAAFIAAERADFAPYFEVRTQGDSDDLFVVKFLEPLANNHAAFGMDLGQEPVRREAAERAMNSGQPALSGKLTLVQDAHKTPGLLYFLPVYRHGADPVTPQQHQAALVGLLYAPMAVGELLNGVPYFADNSIRVELWDGAVGDPAAMLYDSEGGTGDGSSAADADTAAQGARLPWTQVHPLAVGGRVLQLRLRSNALFNATQDHSVLALAAIAGTMASMLASLTVWLLALGRLRAQRLAERMTTDLDRLARVVQHTSNAVMIADPYMRITWVNAGFTRLTGYTLDEACGKTPGELLGSGKADPAVIARLASAVEHGEACRVEVLNRAKDGREYWVDTEVQPTRDHDGELVGFMEIGTDITVQKQAETQLKDALARAEQASIAKSQFVANMSHEIRTPMNAILGMLQRLQATQLTAEQTDFARKTQDAARSLLGLLNDILDFSKVEAGKMELDPRPFDLDQMLASLSVILTANIGNKPVVVRYEVEATVPRRLLGDDMRLQQVLINLGGNAIKFTPSGEVVLRVRAVEQTPADVVLEFSVSDTGIGIAPENQAHIFDGFSQAEASTTRRYGGTGLGLSISSRLVKLLGGQLALSSVLGQGSHFHFAIRLPTVQAAPAAALPVPDTTGAPPAARPQRLQGLRLLVVEDNKINQQVARGLLSKEGAQVTLADDGQLGVAAVAAAQPLYDAVLMDVQMPVMDGYAATRAIRQELGLTSLPIVAMTANAMASDRAACLEAGMDEHIGKPFVLDELVALLQRLVGRPRI